MANPYEVVTIFNFRCQQKLSHTAVMKMKSHTMIQRPNNDS